MKKLFTVVLVTLGLMLGCASMDTQTVKHQLEVTVKSDTDAKITASEAKNDSPMEARDYFYLQPSPMMVLDTNEEIAYITLFSGISTSDHTRMVKDFLFLLHETDCREVHIYINSPGGGAFDGMAIADILIYYGERDFNITAHGSGIIASAAVPIFASCKHRLAAPGTVFMVHEAALWKWPGRETASDIRSQHDLMKLIEDRYINYLPKTSISAKRWSELIKMTTWFNVETAVDWGLVDAIE